MMLGKPQKLPKSWCILGTLKNVFCTPGYRSPIEKNVND